MHSGKKNIKPCCCSSLILKQILCLYKRTLQVNVSSKQNRSRDFFRDVNRSITLQSPYMQIIPIIEAFCPQQKRHKTFTFTFGSLPVKLAVTRALRHVRLLSKNNLCSVIYIKVLTIQWFRLIIYQEFICTSYAMPLSGIS